jgi:hypothetical protein
MSIRDTTPSRCLTLSAALFFAGLGVAGGQSASQKVFYFPKPIEPTPYRAPMKP